MTERALVQVGSARVSYLVGGNGRGVVLVHGASATAEGNWSTLIQRFSKRRRVVAPDLPGSGQTQDSGGRLELEDLAAGVEAAATSAGATPFDLVGYSLGAGIALTLAARRRHLVRRLVLLAGWLESTPRAKFEYALWRRLLNADPELLARLYVASGYGPAFYASATEKRLEIMAKLTTLPEGSARHFELAARLNVRHLAGEIRVPTLVVGFGHDAYVPPSQCRDLCVAIKGAEYVELAGGHLLPFEDPTRIGDVLEAFLQ